MTTALESFHPEFSHLSERSLNWLVGSRMYGMNLESSDYEYKYVYVYPQKDLLLHAANAYPEIVTWSLVDGVIDNNGEDNSLMNHRKLLSLLYKGNPNAVELLYHSPKVMNTSAHPLVHDLIRELASDDMRELVLTSHAVQQYIGHVRGVIKEIGKFRRGELVKKFTAKRIAHALRLARSATTLVSTGKLPTFGYDDEFMAFLREVRTLQTDTAIDIYEQDLTNAVQFVDIHLPQYMETHYKFDARDLTDRLELINLTLYRKAFDYEMF